MYPGERRGQVRFVTFTDEVKRAENEAAFRQANAAIAATKRELEPPLDRVPRLRECDDVGCRETIRRARAESERIRQDEATFAVAHIEEHGDYLVVRKTGGGEDP